CDAPVAALAFFVWTIRFTPKRSTRTTPIPSTSRSKLCLVLSRNPTVSPRRSPGKAGTAVAAAGCPPTGRSTVIGALNAPRGTESSWRAHRAATSVDQCNHGDEILASAVRVMLEYTNAHAI